MTTTKQQRQTSQIEVVETHNLAMSLRRLKNAPGYDHERWKRALLHALGMSYCGDCSERKAVREALNMP